MQVIKAELAPPANTEVSISKEALQERQDLLDRAQTFTSCPDAEAQGRIVRHARAIKALVKDVDAFRKKVKKPFQDFAKLLETKIEEYLEPLVAEEKRIAGLTIAFQQQEAERVRLEEEARQRELNAKLLAAKQAEEAAKKAQEAITQAEAGLSDLEQAALAEMDAAKAQKAYVEKLREDQPAVEKATGQAIRKVLVYEVVDVKALFAAHPETCEIVPVKSRVRELLEAGIELPGVKHHWEKAVSIRA